MYHHQATCPSFDPKFWYSQEWCYGESRPSSFEWTDLEAYGKELSAAVATGGRTVKLFDKIVPGTRPGPSPMPVTDT